MRKKKNDEADIKILQVTFWGKYLKRQIDKN